MSSYYVQTKRTSNLFFKIMFSHLTDHKVFDNPARPQKPPASRPRSQRNARRGQIRRPSG